MHPIAKKIGQAALLAAFVLTSATSVQAQTVYFPTTYTYGDLYLGFSVGFGTDEIYDLGQESKLTNGESWNLSTLLKAYGDYSGVNWGVIGNLGITNQILFTTTAPGTVPPTVEGFSTVEGCTLAMVTLSQNFTNTGAGTWAPSTTSYTISWYSETVNYGSFPSAYLNEYNSPDVVGVGSADFSEVLANSSNPTLLGSFTLAANGVVTYQKTVPAAAFTGAPTTGTAPLRVIFSDASTGSITNWRWNFGDGHLFTNTVSGTATNTYAANGNYTVSLTVSGVNGTNTSTLTNYIVVASATPTAAFYAMATNGFVPLTVVFTNTSTGSITNWVWNLGNGANLTNSTGANVTNTYAAAGVYPVSLIARGPGGAGTNILANYIVASPTPKLGNVAQSSGKLTFSGTNGPVGVQYRVLTSTNLATWTPVLTNKIPANGIYVYTNSWPTNPAAFFKLVSP